MKAVRTPAALGNLGEGVDDSSAGRTRSSGACVRVRAHVGGFMRVGTLVFSKAPFLHAVKRTSLPVRDENIRPPPTQPPPARSGPLSCNVSRPYKASADTPDASWEVLRGLPRPGFGRRLHLRTAQLSVPTTC